MNESTNHPINTRQFNQLKDRINQLTILCVILTLAALVNTYFNVKQALAPGVPQPTLEAFQSGNAIPGNVKHNGLALGEDDAAVTVEMFSDFQCPFCRQSDATVIPQLIDKYVATGKVKFIYHPFSFLGQESIAAAESAYCANDQGKFWEYKEVLFSNQKSENTGGFNQARLLSMGQFIGLDMTRFTTCVQSQQYASQVDKDNQIAGDRNVHSTPTFFVNGKLVASGGDLFQPIEAALK